MPSTRPNLGMVSGWVDDETGWGADMNANLNRLDTLAIATVKDIRNDPPGSPADGDRYLIDLSPTGAWSTKPKQVAVWEGSAWVFHVPKSGWRIFVEDESREYVFTPGYGSPFAAGSTYWRKVSELLNVQHFGNFQAAHDALPAEGGTIWVPCQTGFYTHQAGFTQFTGLVITKNLVLLGETNSTSSGGCVLSPTGTGDENEHLITVNATGNGVHIANLNLLGKDTAGTGCGIYWNVNNTNLSGLKVTNCVIDRTPNYGLKAELTGTATFGNKLYLDRVTFANAKSGGSMLITAETGAAWDNCHFTSCEFNSGSFGATYGTGPLTKGSVHIKRATNMRFNMCSWQGPADTPAVSVEGSSNCILLTDFYVERLGTGLVEAFNSSGFINGLRFRNGYMRQPNGDAKIFKSSTGGSLRSSMMEHVIMTGFTSAPTGSAHIDLGHAADEFRIEGFNLIKDSDGTQYPVVVGGSGSTLYSIASATTITLPNSTINTFKITGTTTITTITAQHAGRHVWLWFTGAVTLNETGNLKVPGTTITTVADSCLPALCDGTNWVIGAMGT